MTQEARTLKYFRSHTKGLTALDFWEKLGIYRAADTVYKLRKAGYDIRMERKKVLNRFGEECKVAYYTLEE